jgi:outer membrane protein OmpA-like peptidoglycan-associated protein
MNRLNIKNFLFTMCWLSIGQLPLINSAQAAPDRPVAQPDRPHLKIIVTSNQDTIAADDKMTLREAIALANGDLRLDRLSDRERSQVQDLGTNSGSRIEFKLPKGSTKIALTTELPAIQTPGVSIDGSTQSGFVAQSTTKTSIVLPTPIVELSPANGVEIARGISILADNVTIRGLSIYGFTVGRNDATQNVPAGDIFIAHRLPPPDTTEHQTPAANFPFRDSNLPPQNITIAGNFLGIKPDKSIPTIASDFGVYVFNSKGTTIRHNTIKDHSASGIITSVKADQLQIRENILIGNGNSGMPDAIRLEGEIRNNKIDTNLICANDGSAVFLFKPAAGAVDIRNNTINFNGRRLRRAAIHLMGSDNQVVDNNISNQAGAGVSVSAFPQSDRSISNSSARNIVKSNRFSLLEGLSVDLNTDRNDAVADFQDGDGINPPRNSENRRLDTGNMAINAPRFLSPDFLILNDRVNVDGIADPGTQVELYQVSKDALGNGSLSRSLATVSTNAQGKFSATLTNLQPGAMISAIATDPKYGTSEPARNSIAITPGTTTNPELVPANISTPGCPNAIPKIANADPEMQTANQVVTPPAQPPISIQPTQPIQLKIPSTIHFALDKSNISLSSGEIINQIAKVLKDHPYIVIDLEGHTDPRANNDYNQRLGMRRAIATRKYLVNQGIDSARITIRSQGETQRKSPRSGVLDYARDRRVEFLYRDMRGLQLEIIDREDDLQLERRRSRSRKSI